MNYWNYLVVLRPTRIGMLSEGPTQEELEAVNGHFAYCTSMVKAGKMLLAGRTQGEAEKTIGIGIFHADSMEEAQEMMRNDPSIIANIMTADVQPYRVALLSENPHNTDHELN